jgi:hypothetical protein
MRNQHSIVQSVVFTQINIGANCLLDIMELWQNSAPQNAPIARVFLFGMTKSWYSLINQ